MVYEERTMKSEKLYEGKILSLRVDTVEIPNKMYSKREIIEHPGSVAIVTIVDEDKLVLVKQYRKAVEDFILEIPAGKIEVNEEPKETAIRELKEETGYEASNMEYMLEFYSSPGYCDEIIYIFLTDDITLEEQELDENENIEVQTLQIDEVMKMIKLGKILDGKTIVGANIAKEYINSKKVGKKG